MGTNYYLRLSGDMMHRLKDGEPEEELHIGKSSGGWVFSLRVHPEHNINTIRDWVRLFRKDNNRIFNEYGDEVTWEEMLDTIARRSWKKRKFPDGRYSSEEQYAWDNHASLGPNGLLRHGWSDSRVRAGGGTWDYINYEFS